MNRHTGDLIVSKNTEVDFDEITGFLRVEAGVEFVAKKLKRVGGDLSIGSNAALEAPKLETVGGYLYIYSNAALEAPKLETVGGNLSIGSNAALEAPKLETVGGYLYIYSNAALEAPKLETVGGNLSIYSNAALEAPKLETVGGDLSIYSNAALEAPKLETVGGNLSIYSNAALEAPKLETVGGDLSIYSNAAFPKLETVGGDLSIYSNAAFPKLETVGGNLHINSSAALPKLVNKNDPTAKATCATALAVSFKKKGLVKIDGILSWFVSKKKMKELFIFKVKIVGKLSFSFVVQRGEQFSHGETVSKAVESLRYKLSDRDTSKFKKWTLTTKVNVEDAIQAYRAITGACELGVKGFCESIKVPKRVTVAEVIKLTNGKYGNNEFAKFFK